jgi:hypothetical protein
MIAATTVAARREDQVPTEMALAHEQESPE